MRVQPSGKRTLYVQLGRGKRIRIGPADVLTLQQAAERAKKALLDSEAAAAKATRTGTLAAYIMDEYEQHALARLKNGAVSVARVRATWKPLQNKRVGEITIAEVDKLRNKRLSAGAAPATVNRDVAALRGVLTHWAANTKAPHPLTDLGALKVADDEKIRYLSPAESTRLRKALAGRDARIAKDRASTNCCRKSPATATT